MVPQSFRLLNATGRSRWNWLVIFLALCFPTIAASAQQQASIMVAGGAQHRTLQPQGCPNQGGIITSISVPVGQPGSQPLSLAILIPFPAPPGGYYFEVSTEDSTIAFAGDPTQGLLPVVFIPEGQEESNTFLLYGFSVGPTFLDASNPNFLPLHVPTAVWDVNPGGDPNFSKFLDANYSDSTTCRDPGSPNLSSDPNILIACGSPTQGSVSDGVSQLLMRMVAGLPGTACFGVASTGPPDQGMIPMQEQVLNTQSVGNFDDAFSFYQAPDVYGDDSDSRTVQVQFFFTPSSGFGNTSMINASLTIIRPPLMLVHGLWSNPTDAWPSPPWEPAGQFYLTYPANYSSTNAANYSANVPLFHDVDPQFVDTALQLARDKHYAATQVDVVAHSMGGLLTRLYAGSSDFLRPENFDMGDVHRLVTLDTPHWGASTANLLVSLNNNSLPFRVLTRLLEALRAIGFHSLPDIYKGAVCDLAENSPALQGLSGGTDLPSQVISATGGPPGAPNGGNYLPSIEKLLTLNPCMFLGGHCYLFPQDIVNGFRFRQENDGIVPLTSELDGLAEQYNFDSYIHTNVTNFPDVMIQVTSGLLDNPDADFLSLPPVPSDGLGHPLAPSPPGVPGRGTQLDEQDYAAQCSPGGPMNPHGQGLIKKALGEPKERGKLAADQRVQVTSPVNGQQFAPGDTVNATVQLTPPLTANAGWLSVGAPGLGVLDGTNYNGSTYQVSFVLPNNYAGPLDLTPDVIDSNNNPIEGVGVTITVRPKVAPLSLTLVEGTYNHLLSSNATARIFVTGNYQNNVQLDLTSSVTGTTYKSSNTQVLTVDTEGNVQAKAFGTAVVTVQNSGVKAFATFDVENPNTPLAPQDLTAGLTIARSGYRLNRNTGFYVQTIEFTNAQAVPMIGPLYFVLNGLSSGVALVNSGVTRNIQPKGSPYLALHTADGITLQPGEHVNLTLQFLDARRVQINYTPKVYRTLATP